MGSPVGQPQAPEAQPNPAPGEQDNGQGAGLYDLGTVPEHLRSHVEPILKDIEGNVTKRFQEAADFRKTWEPLAETGIADIPAQDIGGLVELYQIFQDDNATKEWLKSAAEEYGLLGDASDADDDDDDFSDDDDYYGDGDDRLLKKFEQMLDKRLAPIEGTVQQTTQQQALKEAEGQIRKELDTLHEQHGEFDEDAVCRLAMAYDTPDGIQRAFADYQRIVGDSQRELVDEKMDQPDGPERGGATPSQAFEVKTFEDAKKAALQRLQTS